VGVAKKRLEWTLKKKKKLTINTLHRIIHGQVTGSQLYYSLFGDGGRVRTVYKEIVGERSG
jgi:hypothetical protein